MLNLGLSHSCDYGAAIGNNHLFLDVYLHFIFFLDSVKEAEHWNTVG